jgi:Tfp pilus assembly protein PilN
LNAETVELDRLINQLDIQQIQWGPQLSEIVAQSPPSVELTAIDQSGDEAIFTGRSRAYADALDYQSSLEQSGQYAQVHLLSISRVENESSRIVVSPEAEEDAADENEPASVLSADFLYEFRLLVELNASGAGEQAMEVSQ